MEEIFNKNNNKTENFNDKFLMRYSAGCKQAVNTLIIYGMNIKQMS